MGHVASLTLPERPPSLCTTLSGYVALQTLQYTTFAISQPPLESQHPLRVFQRDARDPQGLASRRGAGEKTHISWCYPKQTGDETHQRLISTALVRRRRDAQPQPIVGNPEHLAASGLRDHPDGELNPVGNPTQRCTITT